MRNLITFREKRPEKNEHNRIYALNRKKQPEKIIADNATLSDFEAVCNKSAHFAVALVKVLKNEGKEQYKLIKINYSEKIK